MRDSRQHPDGDLAHGLSSSVAERRVHVWSGAFVLVAYLLLATAYGVAAPPLESPDEVGHFFTIKYIADRGRLPQPEASTAHELLYGQEGTQPPLYYALGAAIVRLGAMRTDDAWELRRVNPHTTCGSPHLSGNKAFLAHDPARERPPWSGALLSLHVLRLYSTLLGLVALLGVYRVARLCCPGRPGVGLLALGLTALNPQFLFVSAGINNDNLLVPLCTWSLAVLIGFIRCRPTCGRVALAGLLIGSAALTKVGGLLLLPVAGLAIIAGEVHRSASPAPEEPVAWANVKAALARWPTMLAQFALLVGVSALVAGWWYGRNAIIYGDPMLIEHHLDIVSRRDPTPLGHILLEIPSIFYSYWGRFTCDISPGGWYFVYWALLVVAGVSGVIAAWRGLSAASRLALLLLATWFAAVFGGWFRWNLVASGVQGRLLFPAAASVGVIVGGGIAAWSCRQSWVRPALLVSWLGLSLGMLRGLIVPTFAPPTRHEQVEDVEIPNRHHWVFVDGDVRIELLGHDIRPESAEAGDTIAVTLYLSTPEQIHETYSLGLWLVSAVPGATERLTGLDTWPGNGNYPTTAWRPGEVIVDEYELRVPSQVDRTQAWLIQLNAYQIGEDSWLPLTKGGQLAGDRAVLGLVRVGSSAPAAAPADSLLDPAPVFGGAILLGGASAGYDAESRSVRVTLWWEALSPVEGDYTVFAHLVNDQGVMVANGDGPPLDGGFPTRMWVPGDAIADLHRIALDSETPAGTYDLVVGWYDPASGTRLATARDDSARIPGGVRVE